MFYICPHKADVAKLDKAPDYESGDSRFESWHLHLRRLFSRLFLFLPGVNNYFYFIQGDKMPVQDFATKLLEGLKQISQAETVIGKPIEAEGNLIIPVSRVTMGFGLGANEGKSELTGSAGGASIDPVAFLVLQEGQVKLLPVSQNQSTLNKVIDLVPEVIESFKGTKDSQD